MTAPTRIKFCLFASCIAMLIGHWAVLNSGATFDTQTGEHYNVFTRWVSDFAAKWPEGLWIKGSILLFCAALFDFIRMIIDRFSEQRFSGIWKLWWMILATAMIGGLLLVILFDMSPTQYRYHGVSWIERLLGESGVYKPIPRSKEDWIIQGHHRIGFQLFIIGFFLSAVSLTWLEWRSGLREAIPVTVYLLILATIFSVWLFFMKTSVAGIPQRALLLLIFVWVLRSIKTISRTPNTEKMMTPKTQTN